MLLISYGYMRHGTGTVTYTHRHTNTETRTQRHRHTHTHTLVRVELGSLSIQVVARYGKLFSALGAKHTHRHTHTRPVHTHTVHICCVYQISNNICSCINYATSSLGRHCAYAALSAQMETTVSNN